MKNKTKESLAYRILEAAVCQCALLAVVLACILRCKWGWP